MAEDLKLFRTLFSPFALRAVHALKIKGLQYETVFEVLKSFSDTVLEYNPIHKKVPVLVHNGKTICESLVILEYIDETWNQPPLLPRDPYEKATARFWARFGDDKVLPSVWRVFIKQGKEQDEAIPTARENLKLLEEQLKEKKFFGGETINYLDLALGWIANLLGVLEEIIGKKILDPDMFPLLSQWVNNFADDTVIKECWPPHDRMVEKFAARREPYLKAVASDK